MKRGSKLDGARGPWFADSGSRGRAVLSRLWQGHGLEGCERMCAQGDVGLL